MQLTSGFNRSAVALALLACSAASASASVITFAGEDIMATTTSAHPTSSAAAGSFDAAAAAIGNVSVISFESAPLGSFASLTVAPGVTISGTSAGGTNQSILNASNSPTIPTLDGYNTTSGGSRFVEVEGGTLTFTFASPVQFFGAYFSGVQDFFTDVVTFSDGTSQTIDLPEAGTSPSVGALDFIGFTDAGKAISSITLNAGNSFAGYDFIGIDDVRFQSTVSAAPEPSSVALLLLAGALAFSARRSRLLTRTAR
jgi:hypothetical protein